MSDEKFYGWVGHNKDCMGNLVWEEYKPKTWTEDDVQLKITHCGICGSDLHTMSSGWGPSDYPVVVGHEIVGIVTRVGKNVSHLKVGDRAGVGAQCDSCGKCHQCSTEAEPYCDKMTGTYNDNFLDGTGKTYGGYAENWRGNARFAVPIPDGVESHIAAPLMCGGITIFSPLHNNGCGQPGVKKVGIVGIGGIGHFGLAFAKALGADQVVAISSTAGKKDLAMDLGATDFLAMKDDPEGHNRFRRSLDLIVTTANNPEQPFDKYAFMLRPGGKLVNIALPEEPVMPIPIPSLVRSGTFIGGSLVGSPALIHTMLKLVAEKKPEFLIEQRPMKDCNQAVMDMEHGKARFRYTLVNEN